MNGALIPGTQSSVSGLASLPAATFSLSCGAVINTGSGTSILTLNNTSGGTRNIIGLEEGKTML